MCWTSGPLFLVKIPEDGTFMPKYLGVGTKNGSVSYDLYYCISLSEYCWVKYGIHKVL
jgi:hypothetical protein